MLIKFQCEADSFKGSAHDCVSEFDAAENYEPLYEFFASFGESFIRSKEEYFSDGLDYDIWDDYVIWEDEKIVARAAIWKYSQTAWEVAAVSTLPEYRRKGYGEMVVSHCTAIILNNGKIATCTTKDTNTAMRRTAEKVGFTEIKESSAN